MVNIERTGLFHSFHKSKLIALGFLILSLLGAKGKKCEEINYKTTFRYIIPGLLLYFLSWFVLSGRITSINYFIVYILVVSLGFLLILTGGTLLSRIIKDALADDIFNEENETFSQEERLITNEFSINLPAKYRFKGKLRDSWLNFIAVFRSVIVQGGPGAGKTAFVIRHFISQAMSKPEPYTLLVYDFKFPDLSLIAYNHWLKNKHKYKHESGCYFINFDDLSRSHRCNPLDPLGMEDITDASESARTILYGLNKEWQKKSWRFLRRICNQLCDRCYLVFEKI